MCSWEKKTGTYISTVMGCSHAHACSCAACNMWAGHEAGQSTARASLVTYGSPLRPFAGSTLSCTGAIVFQRPPDYIQYDYETETAGSRQ